MTSSQPSSPSVSAQIRALALPTLGALLVEPLLVAADSAMVGHLGTNPLAGLSLASTVLLAAVGLCIFLAYATTAATARLVGAGKTRAAYSQGFDGIWVGLALGIVLLVLTQFFGEALLALFHPTLEVLGEAHAYLLASSWGLPGMLVLLAATGTLRGLGNTRTPLHVTLAGAILNVPASALFIYVAHWGTAGAGAGTAIAQTAMACASVAYLVSHADGARLTPSARGMARSLAAAAPLIIRSASLRVAILVQITVATRLGTVPLASNQITMTYWNMAAYGLDALATAAQILVGQGLGKGDVSRVRQTLRECLRSGLRFGVVAGVVIIAVSPLLPWVMTSQHEVRLLATATLVVVGIATPIAASAYMLDGVLIGAGDMAALARYMLASLAVFTPCAFLTLLIPNSAWGQVALWVSYGVVFMGMRALTLLRRTRGEEWMRLGA